MGIWDRIKGKNQTQSKDDNNTSGKIGVVKKDDGVIPKLDENKQVATSKKANIVKKEKSDEPKGDLDQKDTSAIRIAKPKKEDTKDAYRILMKPIVSEKSSRLSNNGIYAFHVAKTANKVEIKKAIKAVYDVEVISISTMIMYGKQKRFGRRLGKRSAWKKAIIRLKPDQKIELYEGV